MTDPTPDPEPGHGPDDPDLEDPLTADDILARAGAVPAVDGRSGGNDSQATRLVGLALSRYRLIRGEDGRVYATGLDGPAIAYTLRGREGLRTRLARTSMRRPAKPRAGPRCPMPCACSKATPNGPTPNRSPYG